MTSINFHFIDARGTLIDHRHWLHSRLLETYEKANTLMPLRPLDVIVKAGIHVIPEKGHLGHAPEPGLIILTLDPTSAIFRANQDASLERMFAHELHHAARWDGPGYGASLGEALVSEGLAGVFAQEVCGGLPEPWERLDVSDIRRYVAMAASQWSRTDYAHNEWFFGASELPRWLGYSLGFQLVKRYLLEHKGSSSASLVEMEAEAFRGMLGII
ncbi:DUF2268 domain-containing putative Zn-dependent protease [Pseudomonas sp. nanlin1]|uniref:DUF2268 domain-containing putative Zn-dependent protease n=1 Tax=Pseudomonas sp. nanlin1 TaxID=3040605 RepID=UPI00388F947E